MVIKELLNLGLNQKEAEVYLAALQLGMSSVQKIAQKAEINRTSAYSYIKNLISRGLLTSIDKNGKQFYIAEKPEKLKFFYEMQEQELKRKKEAIDKIMPELESLYNVAVDRPTVQFYNDSRKSFEITRPEILSKRYDCLYNIFNYEEFHEFSDFDYIKKLLDHTNEFYVLYIANNKVIDKRYIPFFISEKMKSRYLPTAKFNFLCEVLIADNKVYIAKKDNALAIQDKLFSKTLKMLFMALWNLAEDFDLSKEKK